MCYSQSVYSRHSKANVLANCHSQRRQCLLLTTSVSIHFVIPQYQSRSKSNYSKTQPFSVQANLILNIIHQMQLSIFNLVFNNSQLSSILLSFELPSRQNGDRDNNSKLGRSDSSYHFDFLTDKLRMRCKKERCFA